MFGYTYKNLDILQHKVVLRLLVDGVMEKELPRHTVGFEAILHPVWAGRPAHP